MDKIEALKKKAIFQAARRAMLENEMFLRDYVTYHLPENYGEKELIELNVLLEKIFDNDLFDVVMGNKTPEQFEGVYNLSLLQDISEFAWKHREFLMERKAAENRADELEAKEKKG
ncbi:MAG: succinate dehydrogenase assembly factor 2 [Denitrovibrio sp.]|nr:MAG: succinate dehydrogenase assembly factor 2 [Denitrovibrio sp.]